MPDLDPEDKKIVTLARSARARIGADQGACVRDTDGRTYVGASVALPSLRLDALALAVANAAASGATGLEAAAVVVEGEPDPAGIAAVRDLAGRDTTLLVASSTSTNDDGVDRRHV